MCRVHLCRDHKVDGSPCRAVALKRSPFCLAHARLNVRRPQPQTEPRPILQLAPSLIAGLDLQFEALQDRESILAAINFVYGALSTGRLARKHAARLL